MSDSGAPVRDAGANSEEYTVRKMRKSAREWLKYPSVRLMAERLTGKRRLGSWGTVEIYIQGLRRFVKFLELDDPETALEKMKEAGVEGVTKTYDDFIDWLLEKYSYKSTRGFAFGVRRWLRFNGVKARWKDIDMPTPSQIQEVDRAPTREEIATILQYASLRDKCVIEIAVSSGLRIGTILSLRWDDVSFNYPDVARIKVSRKEGRKMRASKGNQIFFITWITPECRKLLLEYKRFRERQGETVAPESPLIAYKGRFMRVESYTRRWIRLLVKAGLTEKSVKWYKLHFHTLRKYFRTRCTDADVKYDYREHWMTHKGGYLDDSYFRPFEEEHLKEYRKAVPYLSILEAPVMVSKEDMRKELFQMLPDEMLKPLAEKHGMDIGRIRNILAKSKTVKSGELEELARGERKKNENESEDCQKVIDEEDLEKWLAKGWHVSAVLSSGKIVVESNNH